MQRNINNIFSSTVTISLNFLQMKPLLFWADFKSCYITNSMKKWKFPKSLIDNAITNFFFFFEKDNKKPKKRKQKINKKNKQTTTTTTKQVSLMVVMVNYLLGIDPVHY